MVILVMGVAGSGKTTVGQLLAEKLGFEFHDADSYHSEANRQKMANGIPLDDADRAPWLAALAAAIDGFLGEGRSAVLACSALKHAYRAQLLRDPARMKVVHLKGSPALLLERLKRRAGHYMKPSMLESQLKTLEEPEDAITVDVASPPEVLVQEIIAALKA